MGVLLTLTGFILAFIVALNILDEGMKQIL